MMNYNEVGEAKRSLQKDPSTGPGHASKVALWGGHDLGLEPAWMACSQEVMFDTSWGC
jgi:hypothetical protein